ncbi:MAG: hypothetical protein Q9160_003211 [Pyrenula sp. 1 TL-2023]
MAQSPSPSTSSTSTGVDVGDLSATEVLNLELMHHYSTSTWMTLSDDYNALHLKRALVPQQAMSHRFTLHGILALAAQHLAYLKPDQRSRYLPSALSHYDLAVSSYRQSIQKITEENCTMLFAFSSILVQFAFGLGQVQPSVSSQESDTIASIIEIYHYCRGIATLVEVGREWISKGILGYLLRRKYVNAKEENEPPQFKEAFEKIHTRLDRDGSMPNEKKETYQETMKRLLQCAATVVTDPQDKAIAMIVPSTVRPMFVSCLEAREPTALALEAYHAVLLYGLDDFWWGKGWAPRIIADIAKELDESWREIILWPMEIVGLNVSRDPAMIAEPQCSGISLT